MKKNMMQITERFFENIPSDKYGIDLMEFEMLMISGEINEYLLLDVREHDDFQKERIPGSVNIPYSQLSVKIDEMPTEEKVIIISKKGLIAAQISSLLNACGYRTWTLREGIEGYIDIGGNVEGEKIDISA
ncbi:MAG: rhodanese-like domain-containing protein [Bacillota bacterium]